MSLLKKENRKKIFRRINEEIISFKINIEDIFKRGM